ncbi:MAG: hypothetical protein AB7G75_09295 [Candidatus Binatia bacterium]
MARVDLVPREQLDPELRSTLERFERACPDFNPAVFQAMGQNPELSNAFYRFYIPTRLNGVLDSRLKELVRLKIAELNACRT